MATLVERFSLLVIPLLLLAIPLYGALRGLKVYELFTQGAREAFGTATGLIPFLVGILVAIAVLRASGALDLLVRAVTPLAQAVGLPREVVPLALLRPLSGSGALGMMAELSKTYGPDSFLGRLAATMQGSTETTFYVLTVYFGAVGVRRMGHVLPAMLLGDLAGLLAAVYICRLVFG